MEAKAAVVKAVGARAVAVEAATANAGAVTEVAAEATMLKEAAAAITRKLAVVAGTVAAVRTLGPLMGCLQKIA